MFVTYKFVKSHPDVRGAQILGATARLIARKGLHNVRVLPEGVGTDADTSMVDGLAIQVLVRTTEMSVSRLRELLLDAFEPHIRLITERGI
jgi:hypothetical protein